MLEEGSDRHRVLIPNDTKRTLLVEILGLPVAAAACSARPHDVVAGRELLRERIETLPRLRAIVGDRAYAGLAAIARRKGLALDLKRPPAGASGFVPIRPLHRIEHAFAQLGRWRRLSRCYEGSVARARLARGRLGRLSRLAGLDLIGPGINSGFERAPVRL